MQNTHHWRGQTETATENGMGQAAWITSSLWQTFVSGVVACQRASRLLVDRTARSLNVTSLNKSNGVARRRHDLPFASRWLLTVDRWAEKIKSRVPSYRWSHAISDHGKWYSVYYNLKPQKSPFRYICNVLFHHYSASSLLLNT